MLVRDAIDEGDHDAQARLEYVVKTAKPLTDPRLLLRDDFQRLGNEYDDDDRKRDDELQRHG
ncbi:hypothetical protein BJP62_17760 [Jeongeupia sp. USM3]|nr:hypothetical protein BJP62_17760 [Jeongeupia sp. USM3]